MSVGVCMYVYLEMYVCGLGSMGCVVSVHNKERKQNNSGGCKLSVSKPCYQYGLYGCGHNRQIYTVQSVLAFTTE